MPQPRPRSIGSCAKPSLIRSARNSWRRPRAASRHNERGWWLKRRIVQENSVIPGAHRATKAMLLGLALIWLVAQLTIVLIHHFRISEPTTRSALKDCDCLRLRATSQGHHFSDIAGANPGA